MNHTKFLILVALLCTSQALVAQLPVEDCTGADLDGTATFPVGGFFSPASDDFTMTGAGCTEQGRDSVICFTPTSSCTVNISCENDVGTQSANVVQGACTTSPTSCLASGSGASGDILGFNLVGGQAVCVVCEYSATGLPGLTIIETVGSCGALPVELQSFSVEGNPG